MAVFNEREMEKKKSSKIKLPKLKKKTKKSLEKKAVTSKQKVLKEKKKRNQKLSYSIVELMNERDITDEGYVVLSDGNYAEILQIEGKDVHSRNEEETAIDISALAQFYRSHHQGVKIISMNFPVNTTIQKNHVNKLIEKCDNEKFLKQLHRKKSELETIESKRNNREYFLELFSNSKETLESKVINAKRILSRSLMIHEININKKIDLLYKLNNLNSKVENRGDEN
ncbi:hypothetical protein [Bacillus sp. NMCC4]|uniref:hypothetical protein n=1 Tax=unclassified Bacillus (in: firmicutes) TaxID=185979 RepID=UPI000D02B03D|nr:hypothetical protein [Bacillus sp. NMCC4]PRS35715.1 hypothetical protein C6Y02_17020 [Bacillus sp. NMCC4]